MIATVLGFALGTAVGIVAGAGFLAALVYLRIRRVLIHGF